MATAREMKANLRTYIEVRMKEFRELGSVTDRYKHQAYSAIWAASWAEAITDQEREAYLDELFSSKNQQHGQPAPV
jgi:SOS-response transcriptional repressor LexA